MQGRLHLLIRHLAGTAVRQRVEIEDLVQEVCLRAIASGSVPAPSEDDRDLYQYLRTLARHTVIDVVRAARAAKRAGREQLRRQDWSRTSPGTSQLAAPGPGPATRVQGQESAQQLTRAFEELSAEHRRVLGLRKFEGLSARDTAQRMGRSEKAVHSLYRRALEAWEQKLTP